MLWAPLIGKHIAIPPFNPESHREAFRNWPRTNVRPHHHHLYHDSVTEDYKILFLYSECYATYSCNDGRWGEIRGVPRDLVSDGIRRQYAEFVDGSVYMRSHDSSDPVIKCFDARDGMKLHKQLRQPEEADSLVDVDLEAVSGRLCLYGCSDYRDDMLQLWVMVMEEDGSKCWRKLISMEVKAKGMCRAPIPMCLNNEDDVVSWSCPIEKNGRPRRQYYIYNSRIFKQIDVAFEMDFDKCFFYSENLYMPS